MPFFVEASLIERLLKLGFRLSLTDLLVFELLEVMALVVMAARLLINL